VNGSAFESEIQKLDKTQPVYVYCRSGARSQKAAEKMVEMGFTQVIDLEGGYLSWQ
jgi:rhodanese-related sulfurtransferase